MGSIWNEYKLADLCISIFSGGTPYTKESTYWNGNFCWLSSGETKNRYITKTEKSITQSGVDNSSTKKAIPGDIVVASAGQGLTRGQASYSLIETYVNQSVIVVRTNEKVLNSLFLLYDLINRYHELRSLSDASSSRGSLNCQIIKDLSIERPSLITQKKIAYILSAYDDLIENNLRRIKILEEIAQNLYREWFVNFRFPGHKNTRFVDSPLGQIPEGWEAVKVGELLESTKRVAKIPKGKYLVTGTYPIIDQGKDFIGGYTYEEEAIIKSELPVIIFGDHTRVLKFINFPFARGADGTQLLKSNNDRMPMSLFYYTLLAIDLSSYAYARHFKFLKEEKVIIPDKYTTDSFNSFVEPILELKNHLLIQVNQSLSKTRDLLLPKLISGEVDVSELDIKVPEEVAI